MGFVSCIQVNVPNQQDDKLPVPVYQLAKWLDGKISNVFNAGFIIIWWSYNKTDMD